MDRHQADALVWSAKFQALHYALKSHTVSQILSPSSCQVSNSDCPLLFYHTMHGLQYLARTLLKKFEP